MGSVADIGAIGAWNPGVQESHTTSDETSGLGATRFCDLGGKNYLDEQVVEYENCKKITMRVTGNRESWQLMKETMEVDVSDMFEGTSLDDAGQRLFDEVLDICDGKMTRAEAMREWNGFAITRCGPSV